MESIQDSERSPRHTEVRMNKAKTNSKARNSRGVRDATCKWLTWKSQDARG